MESGKTVLLIVEYEENCKKKFDNFHVLDYTIYVR